MKITERLASYFSKNGGINSVTSALAPIALQVVAATDPTLASIIVQSFTPETSQLFLKGGVGAVAAAIIVAVRTFLGWRKVKADQKARAEPLPWIG